MFTAFNVFGLLNNSIFIDLAQIDQRFTEDLNYSLLYVKLICFLFFNWLGNFRL